MKNIKTSECHWSPWLKVLILTTKINMEYVHKTGVYHHPIDSENYQIIGEAKDEKLHKNEKPPRDFSS